MKVYVIKSKQTKEYQTVVMDFIPDIRQSDIFIDYEVASKFCPTDCEVVECELIEKNQLADYTKQVRKELCDEIRDKIMDYYIKGNTAWFNVEKLDKDIVWEILDKIQGK